MLPLPHAEPPIRYLPVNHRRHGHCFANCLSTSVSGHTSTPVPIPRAAVSPFTNHQPRRLCSTACPSDGLSAAMTSPFAVPVSQPRYNSKLSDSVLMCTNRDAHKFNSSELLDKLLRHPTDFFQSLVSYLHLPNPLCSVICTAWMLISIQTPTLCSPTCPITRQMHFVLCPCMRPVSTVRRLKRGLSPRRYATRGCDRCRCCCRCRSLRRAVAVPFVKPLPLRTSGEPPALRRLVSLAVFTAKLVVPEMSPEARVQAS
jgi:hypothetical protein